MKKFLSCLVTLSVVMGMMIPVRAEETPWKEYYVSAENGNDSNPGTKDAPFKTIQAAKDAVRSVNQNMQGDIVVNIESGTYFLEDTLDFRSEDSAYNGHRIYYRGTGDEKPVLSGGVEVTGFKKSAEDEHIWVADFDKEQPLQLSVGGQRRYVAKNSHGIKGVKMSDEYLASEYAIPDRPYDYNDPDRPWLYDGLRVKKSDFAMYENLDDVLCQWEAGFLTYIYNVDEVKEDPDSSDHYLVILEPQWVCERFNNGVKHSNPNWMFTVMNAFELLDEPGEFYYNEKTKKLYYMPVEGEVMNQTPVIAPRLETLVRLDGNDVDDKVTNITFENLHFTDTKLDYHDGVITHQATSTYGSGFTQRSPSAFYGRKTAGINICDNIFNNIGGNAIWMGDGCEDFNIAGNAIYDVGDNGIVVGEVSHNDQVFGSPKKIIANDDDAKTLIQDGMTDAVPEKYKDAAVNLMMDADTRIWNSLYSSGSRIDPHVSGYYESEDNVIDSDPQAMIYPGYPDIEHHNETRDGYWAQKNHRTYMEDLDELRASSNLYDGVWRDVTSKNIGKVPYVMAEFVRPYTLDEIIVTFDPAKIKEGENADYEVLVSNDKSFKEGTYKVIHTQNGTAPSDVNRYKVEDDTKYKYAMIRKLGLGDLAVSRIFVSTYDIKPYVKLQYCDNFTISNNLVERIGTNLGRAIGITVHSGKNGKILHNEIAHTPYTGISVGFSWQNLKASAHNMATSYNYVHHNGKTQLDGGTIYYLGWIPGNVINNNHLVNSKLGRVNVYMDSGSRGSTITENYYELTNSVESIRVMSGEGTIKENKIYGNFSTQLTTWVTAPETNDYTPHTQEIMGQPSRAAYDTYTNAGLEDEYKYLKDLVPEAGDNLYNTWDFYDNEGEQRGYAMRNTSGKQAFEYLLKNGKFGEGLGMYPMEVKEMAEYMLDYFAGTHTSNATYMSLKLEELTDKIKPMLNRYSLEETWTICENTLALAKGENSADYPANAVVEFENELARLKKIEVVSPETEYDVLTGLENAYNKVISKKYSDKIIRVTMPGAKYYEIDEESNTATIYLKKGADFNTTELEITTEGDGVVARLFNGSMNLKNGIKVPVYNRGTKKYRMWTVKAENVPEEINTNITKDTGWVTDSYEQFYMKKGADFMNLCANHYAYMSEVHGGDEETSITFAPVYCNEEKSSFNIILGAKTAEGFDYESKVSDNNRCEITFDGNKATFYKVINGVKTEITSVVSGLKWNDKNELKYKITEINDNAHFAVTLNGKTILSEVVLPKDDCGRYMGFYNPSLNIRIY